MALTPGTRLGPYEIAAQIGVGGMGEVYRATDTTLNRQVAVKVLPESLASDAERIARFEREAKTLASLNHPNIAAIYGFEKSRGVHALVMELVEGLTLEDRIAQGAIPVDEALPIAKQIAEALEAAINQAEATASCPGGRRRAGVTECWAVLRGLAEGRGRSYCVRVTPTRSILYRACPLGSPELR